MTRAIITHLSQADPTLGAVIAAAGAFELGVLEEQQPFEALARAIAHQQLHAKAALAILGRLVTHCGGFPAPQVLLALTDAQLRGMGFSGSKIAALKDLAAKTHEGTVPAREALLALDDEAIITLLTAVRGIGRWTVEMLLLFQLQRPDVMPVDDFGVRNGFRLAYGLRKMPTPRQLAAYAARWAPYRSAAAWYLWRAVDLHKAGTLPAPLEKLRLPRIVKKKRKKQAAAKARTGRTKAGKPTPAPTKGRARTTSSAASTARTARSGARTRARPRPAPRSRAPAKKK